MRRFYLVRHGETDENLLHISQGQRVDPVLNHNGKAQARYLGELLRRICFESVYSSPAKRALETADIIIANHCQKSEVKIEPGLIEINQGDFEGMTLQEVKDKCGDLYKQYKEAPIGVSFPNGESMIDALIRVDKSLRKILNFRAGGNTLIVSHGGALALAFIAIFGWHMDTAYHAIKHHNCGLSIIEWHEKRPWIICMNNFAHLELDHKLMLESEE